MWRLLKGAWQLHNAFWRALWTAKGMATLHAETAGAAPAILALLSRFRSPQNEVNHSNMQYALYSDCSLELHFLNPFVVFPSLRYGWHSYSCFHDLS